MNLVLPQTTARVDRDPDPVSEQISCRVKTKVKGGGSPQLYHHDCSGRIPGYTTRAPPVGFDLETNGFQFYAITNLDKMSLDISQ